MPIRIASRLFRNRHGTFYFRLLIPNDLRACVGRREMRFSLGTEERYWAVPISLALVADLPRLFDNLRRMADQSQTPPPDYLKLWVEEKRKTSALERKVQALADALATAEMPLDKLHLIAEKKKGIALLEQVETLSEQLLDAEAALSKHVPRDRARTVVQSAFLQGQLKGKNELERAVAFPPPPERTKRFSELLAAFMSYQRSQPKPKSPKTLEAYESEIGQFVAVMSDLQLGYIDRAMVDQFVQVLSRLPSNRNKTAAFRDKSIDELLAMNPKPQSVTNVSKHLGRISMMFKWALEEKRTWGIDSNPFARRGQSTPTKSARRPFNVDELKSLFSQKEFTARRFGHSYTYWLMPMAIFTGARIGELAQLDLKDFVDVDGIPCIDINDAAQPVEHSEHPAAPEGNAKRLKTANAKRIVPIHSQLIRLGLLRHVARLRSRGETALFPDLSRAHRDGPTHPASKWFQRYRKRAGLAERQSTVFHSFRHLFITTLLDSGTPAQLVAPIVGHEGGLITEQVYWTKTDAKKRAPTVEAFHLPDEVLKLIPSVEDIEFVKPPGRRPGSSD